MFELKEVHNQDLIFKLSGTQQCGIKHYTPVLDLETDLWTV